MTSATVKGFTNEFAKMRQLGVVPVGSALLLGVLGLTMIAALGDPSFAEPRTRSWLPMLGGMSMGVALMSPLMLAVLASRQVDIEHQGQGWLLSATSGLTPGQVCRAKLVALGAVVAMITIATNVIILGVGLALGVPAPPPVGHWLAAVSGALLVSLVLLALHVVLAAKVENQLVGLGIGVLGTLFAAFASGLPTWLAHLAPWGYYALTRAAEYQGESVVLLLPSWPSLLGLAVVGGVVFALVTGRLDRQEV
ncbi:MAG: ABC transporter permease [Propionibacteriales bacterium]|nr:ABC transporter permease [Propionibacteriales bacterium]